MGSNSRSMFFELYMSLGKSSRASVFTVLKMGTIIIYKMYPAWAALVLLSRQAYRRMFHGCFACCLQRKVMEPCLQCGLCLCRLSPAASGPLLLLFSPRPHPEHSFHTTVPQSTPTCPSLALPPDQFGLLWGFLQHQLPLPNRLSTLKRRHE